MKLNKLVVFDLETSSVKVDDTQILEIAAMAVDPVSWKPLAASDFQSLVRPDRPDDVEPAALAVNGLKMDELMAAPSAKKVMTKFYDYLRQLGGATTTTFNAPFAGGKNIRGFDLPIVTRYAEAMKLPPLFNPKRVFDLDDVLMWTVGQANQVDDISMDTARAFFGIPKTGAHRALLDVRQTAWLLCKMNRLFRHISASMSEKFQEAGRDVDFASPGSWFSA